MSFGGGWWLVFIGAVKPDLWDRFLGWLDFHALGSVLVQAGVVVVHLGGFRFGLVFVESHVLNTGLDLLDLLSTGYQPDEEERDQRHASLDCVKFPGGFCQVVRVAANPDVDQVCNVPGDEEVGQVGESH